MISEHHGHLHTLFLQLPMSHLFYDSLALFRVIAKGLLLLSLFVLILIQSLEYVVVILTILFYLL